MQKERGSTQPSAGQRVERSDPAVAGGDRVRGRADQHLHDQIRVELERFEDLPRIFPLLLVVFIFGARKIPEVAKGLGEGIRGFRSSLRGDEEESDSSNDVKNVTDGNDK